MAIQTRTPGNNQVIKRFEEMTLQALAVAISIADETYQSWRLSSYPHRAELLYAVAKLMRQHKDRLAKVITLEMVQSK